MTPRDADLARAQPPALLARHTCSLRASSCQQAWGWHHQDHQDHWDHRDHRDHRPLSLPQSLGAGRWLPSVGPAGSPCAGRSPGSRTFNFPLPRMKFPPENNAAQPWDDGEGTRGGGSAGLSPSTVVPGVPCPQPCAAGCRGRRVLHPGVAGGGGRGAASPTCARCRSASSSSSRDSRDSVLWTRGARRGSRRRLPSPSSCSVLESMSSGLSPLRLTLWRGEGYPELRHPGVGGTEPGQPRHRCPEPHGSPISVGRALLGAASGQGVCRGCCAEDPDHQSTGCRGWRGDTGWGHRYLSWS